MITDAPGDASWPITATNFILMYKTAEECRVAPRPPRTSSAGSTPMATPQAKALDYVPLPAALVKQIDAYWAANFKY